MKSLLVLLAGAALGAGLATPAMAEPAPPQSSAQRSAQAADPANAPTRAVTISIEPGTGSGNPTKTVDVDCRSVSGSHPHADTVCAALERVGGDITALQPRADVACSMLYDPVTVTASGIWDGRQFWLRRTFGNRCQMEAVEGDLFKI